MVRYRGSRDGMVCAAVRQAVIYWIFGGGTSTLPPRKRDMNPSGADEQVIQYSAHDKEKMSS